MTYDQHPGLNQSGIKAFLECPALYDYQRRNPQNDTAAMKFGRLLHAMLLEPLTVAESYVIMPEGLDRRTREGKAQWEALLDDPREKIKHEDYLKAQAMSRAISAHDVAFRALQRAVRREEPVYWTFSPNGNDPIAAKARIDALIVTPPQDGKHAAIVVVDLKTTANSANPELYCRDAMTYGLDIQAYWYYEAARSLADAQGWEGCTISVLFIAVEKDEPHFVSTMAASERLLESGKARVLSMIGRYRECLASSYWPAYEGVMTLDVPEWRARQMEGGAQ